jgi:integrase
MASIYRRKKGGCFYITYQARPGERHTVKGCKDRAATEALARKLEADAMLRREGVIDVRAEKLARSEFLPLEKHLETFETAMRGKGGTAEHVDRTLTFIRDFLALCRFKNLADLDAARVAACVTDLKRDGLPPKEGGKKRRPLSARAVNARLTALKSFTRWLFCTERMRTDPMMQVAKLNAKTDRRLIRRALLDEEVTWLIQAAEKGPVVRDMTGPKRAMLYRLAVETGLRAGELASLTPASFNLADLDAATVKVTAAYSKHRRDDVLPLRRDMAEAVTVFIAGKPADARLFAVPPRTAEMIQTDLAAAREAWIKAAITRQEREARRATAFLADTDGSGRVVDFHALRHTFITRLARSGVAPAVAKSLARHSTIVLTMDHYTHTLIGDERAALDRLPAIGLGAPAPAAVRATGT